MITINLPKARDITHTRRRSARSAEFAPLDDIIAKQLPGMSAEDAEAERAAIRVKYAAIQTEIDASPDVSALSDIIASVGL